MKQRFITSMLLWALFALGASLIPIRPFLAGGQLPFTAFEFVGPLAGIFVGPLAGALSAFAAKSTGFLIAGTTATTFGLARLITPAFAAIYLGTKSRWILIVPALAIIGFLVHPIGRQAPVMTLLWLVPIALWPLRRLFYARALGATLTAHAVGGLLTVWLLPTKVAFWLALPAIVISERLVFALGLTLSYVVIKETSTWLATRWPVAGKVLTPALK